MTADSLQDAGRGEAPYFDSGSYWLADLQLAAYLANARAVFMENYGPGAKTPVRSVAAPKRAARRQ